MLFGQELKDLPDITDELLAAANKPMTEDERRKMFREQMVSWIMGMKSDGNTITREEVEAYVNERYR